MNPQDEKTLTIARRTRDNLEFMDDAKDNAAKAEGKTIYEVTQLLNSLLGMLILLREEHISGKSLSWDKVKEMGVDITKIDESLKTGDNFNHLIGKIRNALVHNNFEFVGESEITGMKVKTPKRQKNGCCKTCKKCF